ncbi:MAG: hypothetical protein JKY81_02320 [Colwellia sp.]|nr:hypothetical protein [Colwellia sp.]
MAAVTAAVILIAATAAQANETRQQGKRVERAEEKRATIEKGIQGESAARSRRAEVRKRLTAVGQIENVAAQTGGAGGTAATQSISSVQTQSASNIGAINARVAGQRALTDANQDIFKAQQTSSTQLALGVVQSGASIFSIPSASTGK